MRNVCECCLYQLHSELGHLKTRWHLSRIVKCISKQSVTMDCTLISGILGVILLFKIKGSYGQTNTSVLNITTTDKPYSKNEDEGPSPVLIAGPVIGGLIVIWVVTMMCRDCYHKKQLKCFLISCVVFIAKNVKNAV